MKLIRIFLVVALLAAALIACIGPAWAAEAATQEDKVTICHVAGRADNPANYVTLTLPWNAVYGQAGHLNENGTPQAGHEQDYLGECKPPSIAKLNLTFMQPCKPAEGTPQLAEWRITNPNAFSVAYTVEKYGTGQILSGTAPAGQSFFTTPWGAQTLILKWNGGSVTKAGGNTYNGKTCPVDPCEYNPQIPKDDPLCVPPPPKKECKLEQQSYGLAALFFPVHGWQTVYFYEEIPIGIGVERQLCIFGETAINEGAFDWVYRDSCTGEYFWNGQNVTPRPDVLKDGVCARNGACLTR